MPAKASMSLNELMRSYLSGSKVANGGKALAAPGVFTTVFVETQGGEGYTTSVRAKAWGHLRAEPVVLLLIPAQHEPYALSYATYREICNLLSSDLSKVEVLDDLSSAGAQPGDEFSVTLPGRTGIRATAWYEIPLGSGLRLFEVSGKRYGISLNAPKAPTRTVVVQSRSNIKPDARREIIWRPFDLTGNTISSPDFPRKPDYLL